RLGVEREVARRTVLHADDDVPVARGLDPLLDLVTGVSASGRACHGRDAAAAAVSDLVAENATHDATGDRPEAAAFTGVFHEVYGAHRAAFGADLDRGDARRGRARRRAHRFGGTGLGCRDGLRR